MLRFADQIKEGAEADDGRRRVIRDNTDQLDALIAQDESSERAEKILHWLVGIAVVLAAAGITTGLVFLFRGVEGARAADLTAAEQTVVAGLEARVDAFKNLDTSGLAEYFSEDLVAEVERLIEELRRADTFIDGVTDIEIVGSQLFDDQAAVGVVETAQGDVRSLSTGRSVGTYGPEQARFQFELEKAEDGRWRVVRTITVER